MARKSKGKFTMKGHALPGINQKSETTSLKDGRAPSSALQMKEAGSSPNKILGTLGVAGLAGFTDFITLSISFDNLFIAFSSGFQLKCLFT